MYSNLEQLLVEDVKEDVLSRQEQKLLFYY